MFEVGGGLGFVIGPTLGGILYEVSLRSTYNIK